MYETFKRCYHTRLSVAARNRHPTKGDLAGEREACHADSTARRRAPRRRQDRAGRPGRALGEATRTPYTERQGRAGDRTSQPPDERGHRYQAAWDTARQVPPSEDQRAPMNAARAEGSPERATSSNGPC